MTLSLLRRALLGAAALALPAAHATGWQAFGPSVQANGYNFLSSAENVSGRVSAIAYSPNYNGQGTPALYVGSAGGGIWRSADFASAAPTWTPLTDNLGLAPATEDGAIDTGSIAVDPNHPNIIYVGTGEASFSGDSRYGAGILKSTNGGDTWTLLGASTFGKQSISKILVDPTDTTGSTLYAAMVYGAGSPGVGTRGLYKSVNGGTTWTLISTPIGSNLLFTDLDYTVNVSNAFTLYAAAGYIFGDANNGVYKSTNGGSTWTRQAGVPSGISVGRISLAADHTPSTNPAVCALVTWSFDSSSGSDGGTVMGFRRTTNGGATWSSGHPGDEVSTQGWYDLALGLAPDGTLYAGGVSYPFNYGQGVMSSTDNGQTWQPVDVGANSVTPHSDGHVFAFVNGVPYYGNDGGIWRLRPGTPTLKPFAPRQFADRRGTEAVAAGNLNGDTALDVAVVNDYNNTVDVFLGNGDATLQPRASFTAGANASPESLALGDFNGDGYLDVATANYNTNSVGILLGNGSGALGAPTTFPTGAHPYTVVSGDFNNDGNTDLAVANSDGNSVTVMLGNGDGTFGSFATYSVGIAPYVLTTGDFNNDGHTDLAVACNGANSVSILLGSDAGTFTNGGSLGAGNGPFGIASGDVNSDGKTDLVVVNSGNGSVGVLRNLGGATFAPMVSYNTNYSPYGVTVADLNGDGKPDIAATGASGDVTLLYNTGAGAFTGRVDIPDGQDPFWIIAGDFNGDGKTDLATANYYAGTVSILPSVPSSVPTPGQWDDLNTSGLQTLQLQGLGLHPTDAAMALEGSQDNGTSLRDGTTGNTWDTTSGGDGGRARYNPQNGSVAYKVAPQGSFGVNAFFQVSTNGGRSWNNATNGISGDDAFPGDDDGPPMFDELTAFPFYPIFNVDPSNGARLAIGSDFIYESKDSAATWQPISGALAGTSTRVSALAYAPSQDNTIYAAFESGKVYATQNDGANWVEADGGMPWGSIKVTDLAVDPTAPNIAYLTIPRGDNTGGRVWRTADFGAHWVNISGSLPAIQADSVNVETRNGRSVVYVGLSLGVWATTNNGAKWYRYGQGLPNAQVLDLQLNTVTNLLGAGTHGRGVYVISIKPGDVNGDNLVDTSDAVEALRIAGGLETATADQALRAGVAPDTGLTLLDATTILRLAFGL